MSQANEWLKVLKGMLLLFGLHILALILFFLLSAVFAGMNSLVGNSLPAINVLPLLCIAGIGLSQFVYVIPTLMILSRNQRYAVMKGVMIGAAMTTLLNAGCFIWFNRQFR